MLCFSCNNYKNKTKTRELSTKVNVTFKLESLKRKTFNYFWELGNNDFYQIPDRYPKETFYSISATSFGLVSYIIGIEKGYITYNEGRDRVLKTLKAIADLPQSKEARNSSGNKGFYYHFLNLSNANRYKKVELSSIDTGLLIAGILTVQSYFTSNSEKENQIRNISDQLYKRVQWDWMMNKTNLLSMGWLPESGFLPHYWDGYNEAMILYILALGSPTYPIDGNSWIEWTKTYLWQEFMGYEMVNFSPLFGHQFSQAFIDFRGIKDQYMKMKGIDYFENSKRATLSNRAYCIKNPNEFVGYSENSWGLSASDGPGNKSIFIKDKKHNFHKYGARGVSNINMFDDGTIAPYASGASLPFTPDESMACMKFIWENYYEKIVGKYGFKDAYNLTYTYGKENENGWFDPDYIGIDQGILLMQIENYNSELIWNILKKNTYIIAGLKKAGFEGGWLDELNNKTK